jgi:hypothetical protein
VPRIGSTSRQRMALEERSVTLKLNIIKRQVVRCVLAYRFHRYIRRMKAMSKLVYRLWLCGLVLTLLGVARLAPKECTLTHNRNPLGSCGGSDPWSYSAYQSSIVQVLCHPRARVAGLREGVVGLSGGTVPRAACRIQLAWSLISSG